YSAALITGIAWLFLGLTGLAARLAKMVPPTVVVGIVFGLGFGFMLQGIKMMQGDWLIAVITGSGTLLLMGNKKVPAMFVLLAFGAAVGVMQDPALLDALSQTGIAFHTPTFALNELSWNQFLVGAVLL